MNDHIHANISVRAEEKSELPTDLLTLHLVATGVLYYHKQITKGTFLKEDYPLPLEQGLNRLDALLYQERCSILRSVPHLLALCQRPFDEWPLQFPNAGLHPQERLLEGSFPTRLCENLACTAADVEAELNEQRFMNRVFTLCKETTPAFYVEFRHFLISHPVLTAIEFLECQEHLACAEVLKEPLQSAYEIAPPEYIVKGHFLCCPHCGNLLQPSLSHQVFLCEDERCRQISFSSRFSKTPRSLPARQGVYWLRRDLRRFVMMPGRAELRLAEKLRKMGVEVEMWPAYDRYDLRVILHTRRPLVLAIDVKDWANPLLLARKVKKQGFPKMPEWDFAYFVFPLERHQSQPHYVHIFQSICNTQPTQLPITGRVKAAFEHQFLSQVRTLLRREGVDAH